MTILAIYTACLTLLCPACDHILYEEIVEIIIRRADRTPALAARGHPTHPPCPGAALRYKLSPLGAGESFASPRADVADAFANERSIAARRHLFGVTLE